MPQKEKHSAAERKIFGQRIARARYQPDLEIDWTQEELAEKIGRSPDAVKRWELGIHSPPETVIPKLAETLHISEDSLRYIGEDPDAIQFDKLYILEYERKMKILSALGITVKRTGGGGAILEFFQDIQHSIYIENFTGSDGSFYPDLGAELSKTISQIMTYIKNHGEEQNERAKYLESKMEKHPKQKGGSDNGQH